MEVDVASDSHTNQSGAYLSGPGQSEIRWMGETVTHFLATGASTNDRFCLVEETAKRGETVPLHRHVEDVESFYILDGEITFFFDGNAGIRAGSGTFVHLPGGAIHGFRIESDTARYLILTTPRHGEFYRAISIPTEENGLPATFAVDGANLRAAVSEYGIEFIGALPDQ